MICETEQGVARSLTGEDTAILPFIPYILQDLWELGASAAEMVNIAKANVPLSEGMRVLDLGCGKGAVSVWFAKEFGVNVKGIDYFPEFIEYARKKAVEHSVSELCSFHVGDITQQVRTESGYDIVIYGAVGDVLGRPLEMIEKLAGTIISGGYILLDDAWTEDAMSSYPSREQWNRCFEANHLSVVCEIPSDGDATDRINIDNQEKIAMRAAELVHLYPQHEKLLSRYVKLQLEECEALATEVTGVVWLLEKKSHFGG